MDSKKKQRKTVTDLRKEICEKVNHATKVELATIDEILSLQSSYRKLLHKTTIAEGDRYVIEKHVLLQVALNARENEVRSMRLFCVSYRNSMRGWGYGNTKSNCS